MKSILLRACALHATKSNGNNSKAKKLDSVEFL
jgi:hypothetical protein